ncbi:MAG: hypothetical protein WBM41_11040 [Arenicellales bacterium]
MSGNAEEGIARVQAAAAKSQGAQGDGLRKNQDKGIAYLNERILIFVFSIAFIGLIIVWATANSPFVLYGSFASVVLLIILWGVARIKQIKRIEQVRQRQAEDWIS